MPIRTQTSAGMETPDETMARARQMLNQQQPVTQEQASQMTTQELSRRLAPAQTPTPAEQITPPTDVPLPTPEAGQVHEDFMVGVQTAAEQARARLDQELQQRRETTQQEIQTTTQERDRVMEEEVQPLTEPFRERTERDERQRLHIEENFEANQRLVSELEQLLTEGNQLIRQQLGQPVAQRVVNQRANQAMRDVEARAGVIQAVMSARNNQIAQAQNFIDRTVQAITADRQDELNYFSAIIDAKNQNILRLQKQDEQAMNEQMNLIARDLERAEATADYLKQLMIDPQSAQFMADAGITLNDSIDEINQKMAQQSGRDELRATINAFVEAGYEYVPFPQGDTEGMLTQQVGDETLHFRVRPGSQLDLDQQQTRLGMQATRQQMSSQQLADRARRFELALSGDARSAAELGLSQSDIQEIVNPGSAPPMTFDEFSNNLEEEFRGQMTPIPSKEMQREIYQQQVVRPRQEAGVLRDAFNSVAIDMPLHTRGFVEDNFNELVRTGRTDDARDYVKRIALESQGEVTTRQAIGRVQTITTLNQIEQALEEYEAAGGNLGRLTGRMEDLTQRIGRTSDPTLARIENRINAAVVAYTTSVAGAQFSDKESERYQNLHPTISNNMALNREKIGSLRDQLETNDEAFYRTIIGTNNYDRLFGEDAPRTSFTSTSSGRTFQLSY